MAVGIGLFQAFYLIAVAFWVAIAIPTSPIASRIGHPKWIAYVAWWPFGLGWIALLILDFFPGSAWVGSVNFFFWLPDTAYLWVLATKKTHAI